MKLQKFKLIDNGYGGIRITGIEYSLTKGGIVIPDNVNRERKVGMGLSFLGTVAKLKYYFLNLTGHWIEPFDKYYDRTTHTKLQLPTTGLIPMGQQLLFDKLNKVDITGVITTENSFMITGTYSSYGDKKIGISTRAVTEDDDAGFFNEAMGVINEVFFLITTFFKENMLPATSEPAQYLSRFSDSNKEDFVGLSKDELIDRAIDELQKRGAIILMPEGGGSLEVDHIDEKTGLLLSVEDGGEKIILDTRTGSIDGKHLEEVNEKIDIDQKTSTDQKIDPEIDIVKSKEEKVNKKKHANNSPENKEVGKQSNKNDNDREFPQDNISDEDIKSATETVVTEDAIPPEASPKVQRKKTGSTLVSEKDFAAATGEAVREDTPVDLTAAEFSENENVKDIDEWRENVTDESELSNIDIEDSIQNPD